MWITASRPPGLHSRTISKKYSILGIYHSINCINGVGVGPLVPAAVWLGHRWVCCVVAIFTVLRYRGEVSGQRKCRCGEVAQGGQHVQDAELVGAR